jgi:hypothetical protein
VVVGFSMEAIRVVFAVGSKLDKVMGNFLALSACGGDYRSLVLCGRDLQATTTVVALMLTAFVRCWRCWFWGSFSLVVFAFLAVAVVALMALVRCWWGD